MACARCLTSGGIAQQRGSAARPWRRARSLLLLRATVRRAEAADLPRLLKLEELHPGANWNPSQIEAELMRERATVLVVDDGGAAVGWTVGWAVADELHLLNLAVHPDHRRRGHARALLVALMEAHRAAAQCVQLEVRASNEGALRLYEGLGFERMGLRKRYYADGEDAVLMTLLLRPGQAG